MYKILNSKYDDSVSDKRFCDIYCDSEDDLPTPAQIKADFIDIGSWAWIGDERTFVTLQSDGTWA